MTSCLNHDYLILIFIYFIVFALTRPGFEPSIYRIHGERSNYHTTDALDIYRVFGSASYKHYTRKA
jgi:hypothetical protein